MARSSGSKIGTKVTLRDKYTYGEEAEISNRDKAGFQNHPTSFGQIGPSDHGGNLNVPTHTVKSGKFKFNPEVK